MEQNGLIFTARCIRRHLSPSIDLIWQHKSRLQCLPRLPNFGKTFARVNQETIPLSTQNCKRNSFPRCSSESQEIPTNLCRSLKHYRKFDNPPDKTLEILNQRGPHISTPSTSSTARLFPYPWRCRNQRNKHDHMPPRRAIALEELAGRPAHSRKPRATGCPAPQPGGATSPTG